MPSPILARADALMHRRRQSDQEMDDIPVLTDAIDTDDFPVLTDIDPMPATAALEPPPEPAPLPVLAVADRHAIAQELALLIEQRLREELPNIVSTAVMEYLDRHPGVTER